MVFPAHLPTFMERALMSFSSSLEQLMYLSSVRNIYSGHYLHEGWDRSTPEMVHQAFSQCHADVFQSLLSNNMKMLCEEMLEHSCTQTEEPEETAQFWLENEPFREMIPTGCNPVDREYFISRFRIALQILEWSPDLAVLGEQSSLPRPQSDL